MPDCAYIHVERRKTGVTLELPHLEYLEKHPNGFRYTQFCERYREWLDKRHLTMRQEHRAGEKFFVDYSGKKPDIVDPKTGEVIEVELFVAGHTLPPLARLDPLHVGYRNRPLVDRRYRIKRSEESMSERWLGLDFSGDNGQWSPGTTRSNVWMAELERRGSGLVLSALQRVQTIPGSGDPFSNLVEVLRVGSFRAAGIDAPFSIPAAYLPAKSHAGLMDAVRHLPKGKRCFACAQDFVYGVTGLQPPLDPPKPLRETERLWSERGVNVRSTLWAGPRGGAPMTCACLTLLDAADRPVWPFVQSANGLLVEAFPAAQLKQWGLPHQEYSEAKGQPQRNMIVDAMRDRAATGEFETQMRGSADATDAVICAFGAIAAVRGNLAYQPTANAALEGWIAVHE
jgi:hypothetical protein